MSIFYCHICLNFFTFEIFLCLKYSLEDGVFYYIICSCIFYTFLSVCYIHQEMNIFQAGGGVTI